MSDRTRPPRPDDLDLIARLIDQSSLGSPEAWQARGEIAPSAIMVLRDRAYLDAPTRGWPELTSSTEVLRLIRRIFPPVEGPATRIHLPSDVVGPMWMVSRHGEIRKVRGRTVRLPRTTANTSWCVYAPTMGPHRCELGVTVDGLARPSGRDRRWTLDLAMIWEIADLNEVLRKHASNIEGDLLSGLRDTARRHLDDLPAAGRRQVALADGSLPLPAKLGLERDLEALLRSYGLQAEVAIRAVSVPTGTGGSYRRAGRPKPVPVVEPAPRPGRQPAPPHVCGPLSSRRQP
jgi:hypothetical protein